MKRRRNPCFGYPPVYHDLSTRHEWRVKNPIVDLPIRLKRYSKRTSGNSLSASVSHNKVIGAASQTLLTGAGLPLRRRLSVMKSNSRFTFIFCRLWTNMSDKDFEVLQTALSPEVSESEEQVCPYYYCIHNL